MTLTYRIKLFITLLIAAIVLMTTISVIDYKRLKEQTIQANQVQVDQATEAVLYALDSIDRAYHYMDQEIGLKMEEYSTELQKKYNKNKDFSTWKFDELAEGFGMDIYILNDDNEVIHSNVDDEVGMEFAVCCKSLNKTLHERRKAGHIFIDGIDRDQKTGDIKKYSYQGTKDKKYLIEIGYSLKNEVLFKDFNFMSVAGEIVDQFTLIEDVHVLNYGGMPYGAGEDSERPEVRREAFEKVRESNEILEVEEAHQEMNYIFRYVPYQSAYDASSTQTKVVEIMYSDQSLNKTMQGNLKTFMIQFLIALIVAGGAAFALAHILSKPIYLAYFDPLTKLKNRASFDIDMKKIQEKKQSSLALFFIDIDKFKSINAFLGHEKSDVLLQAVGNELREIIKDEDGEVYRFGGDEFAMVMQNMAEADVEFFATALMEKIDQTVQENPMFKDLKISISVGIALSTSQENIVDLFKQADLALYKAKKKGHNHFYLYREETDITVEVEKE